MNLNASNLSTSERLCYMPHEVLDAYPFIEQWAEADIKLATVADIQCHLSEARDYPSEDFLEGIIKQVRALMPKSSSKLAEFKELLDSLDALQLSTANASDYAMEELTKAENLLSQLEA